MTEQEISNALRERLAGTADAAPIVLENAPGVYDGAKWVTPEPPFWLVTQVKQPPERQGVSDWHIHRGRLVVGVMTRDATFATEAETQAEKILARFPAGLKMPAGTGTITFRDKAYGEEGFNDGAYWRVNVHIRWEAVE